MLFSSPMKSLGMFLRASKDVCQSSDRHWELGITKCSNPSCDGRDLTTVERFCLKLYRVGRKCKLSMKDSSSVL